MGKRFFLLDFWRCMAFPLVILQHVSAINISKFNDIPLEWWWISNFFDSISRICVPLFFIITGALMFENDFDDLEDIKIYLKKRLLKIVVPLISWSFIYTLFFSYWNKTPFNSVETLRMILSGTLPSVYHFWYLYAILGLYIIAPVLKVCIKNANKTIINYFLFVWIMSVAIIPLFQKFNIYVGIDIKFLNGFLGYLLIGHKFTTDYVKNKNYISKKTCLYFSLCFVLCLFFTMCATYNLTQLNGGKIDEFFYNYTSINVMLMTISFCVISIYFFENMKSWSSDFAFKCLVYFSSKLSFGVYLIHLLVMAFLDGKFKINGLVFNPFIAIPLTTVVVLIVSSILISLIRKIPFGKVISP